MRSPALKESAGARIVPGAVAGTSEDAPARNVTQTRVIFLNSPTVMGADSRIQALLMRYLDASSYEVSVACSSGPIGQRSPSWRELEAIEGVSLRRTNFGPTLFQRRGGRTRRMMEFAGGLASLFGLAFYIRRRGIRIVHASDRPRDALACVLLAKLTGAKSVIHLHVKYSEWQSKPVRWAMHQADALLGISEFVSDSLRSKGFEASKVHTILNSIDLGGWDYSLDGAPVRAELGLPVDAPVVVSISRLIPWKGQADLIRAIAQVRAQVPDVRLVIVGSDDAFSSTPLARPYSADLQALVEELGLSANVTFAGQRANVPHLLAAADIFALPSFEEPFGLVYLEAMAMKKPVVALDNGGTPEVVKNGESGLLSPPGDNEALVANILALIRQPALRARLGENGRRSVEDEFTPAMMASSTQAVYESLLH